MCPSQSDNRWVVVYDGKCAFCQSQIDKIKRHDSKNIFEYIPNDTPDILKRFPQLAEKDLNTSLWLVAPDGTLYAASDAIYHIMCKLEKYKWLAPLYRLPLFHWTAQQAYRWIASHRK